eukprot:TRINITY_DN90085_c0_g1_i1.p1 TRINITY_DN90085_c0_g1~~TRINITY_DN90085_c0_g1_i1.p1  ORF type:complete len:214 (-),score=55.89 TRINITY_DN90085_c0_g1_i1:105-746(-)
MGNVCCTPKEVKYSALNLQQLLAGSKQQVSDRPEVRATIREFSPKVVDVSIDPREFCLEGALARIDLELIGSNQEIMRLLGAELALKLLDKVDITGGRKTVTNELAPTVPGTQQKGNISLIEVKEKPQQRTDRVGSGKGQWDKGQTRKTVEMSATVSMSRKLGGQDVHVSVHSLTADTASQQLPVTSKELQDFVKVAISKAATDVVLEQMSLM